MQQQTNNSTNGSRWANLGRALKSRNYRLFFFGQGVSLIGTWMQRAALSWVIAVWYPDERVASFWVGIVGFAGQIPAFVLAPLAGVLADRWNRHHMVVSTQTMAMVQAFVLAGLMFAGVLEIWHVIVLAFFLGAVTGVDVPTRQSFVIEMVDRPEDLNNAIALNSSVVNGGRLIGPALGTMLIWLIGAGWCFLTNGLSYLAVIFALLAMTIKPRQVAPTKKRVLHHLAEGASYAFKSRPIISLLAIMTLVSLAGIPYASLLAVFAKHVLNGGPMHFGFLMSGVAIGALAAGIHLAMRTSVRGLGRFVAFAPVLMGVALIAFSMSPSFWISLAIMPFIGLGQMLLMASCNTIIQTIVDDDKRGRVMSFYSMSFMGMVPLGNLMAGFVALHIGPQLTVAIGGSICILGGLNFARKLPALRKLVHPIYVRKGIIPEVAVGLQVASEMNGPPSEKLSGH